MSGTRKGLPRGKPFLFCSYGIFVIVNFVISIISIVVMSVVLLSTFFLESDDSYYSAKHEYKNGIGFPAFGQIERQSEEDYTDGKLHGIGFW